MKFPIFDDKDYRITSPYGERINPVTKKKEFHDGIDFGTPTGTPQKFLSAGTIRSAKADAYGGLYVQLKRTDGKGEWFLHCSKLLVKAGDKVKAGQVVAYSGNTGMSTAPHTHYGMQSNADVWSSRIDPMPFLLDKMLTVKVGEQYKTTADSVRIRKSAGVNQAILATLKKGSVVVIVSTTKKISGDYLWIQVKAGSTTGWMAWGWLEKVSTPAPVTPPQTQPVDPCEEKIKQVVSEYSERLKVQEDTLEALKTEVKEKDGFLVKKTKELLDQTEHLLEIGAEVVPLREKVKEQASLIESLESSVKSLTETVKTNEEEIKNLQTVNQSLRKKRNLHDVGSVFTKRQIMEYLRSEKIKEWQGVFSKLLELIKDFISRMGK